MLGHADGAVKTVRVPTLVGLFFVRTQLKLVL